VRFLKANKIFNGKIFLPDNSVLVLNGQNNLIEKQESTIKHLEETIDRLNKKVDALCEIIIKLTEKKP
jgi:hypothetical protein